MKRFPSLLWVGLGILLLTSFIILLAQLSKVNPVYSAICILLAAIIGLATITIRMSVNQRVKAKGAKKRREKLLPLFYRRKKKKRKPSK